MLGKIKGYIVWLRDLYLVKVKWRRYSFGKGFHAGKSVVIWGRDKIQIGDNCYIGRNSQIECNVEIGNDVLIANSVAFVGRYDHHYQEIGVPIRQASQVRDADYSWLEKDSVTKVEDDVWIGYGAIILSGVTIKKGSIIAAGSLVTKDVESYSIYGGNPAKKITNRFNSLEELEQHKQIVN
jgi:acetyltransferase-like isoleucine patch superfamily enzyme